MIGAYNIKDDDLDMYIQKTYINKRLSFMRYAIYRIHYGLDFLGKSIESVIDEVDKVFVF